jgi:hypothetical protein
MKFCESIMWAIGSDIDGESITWMILDIRSFLLRSMHLSILKTYLNWHE